MNEYSEFQVTLENDHGITVMFSGIPGGDARDASDQALRYMGRNFDNWNEEFAFKVIGVVRISK